MKKEYQAPFVEVLRFVTQDVLTASGIVDNGSGNNGGGNNSDFTPFGD